MRRSARTRIWIAAAMVAATAAGASVAAASPTSHVSVRAVFDDPGMLGFTNPAPDCSGYAPGGCAFAFDGTTTETGDLRGHTRYHGWLYGGSSPAQAIGWQVDEVFTGTVRGCGRGSFRWRGSGYGDVTAFDPQTQSAPLYGELRIVAGSGRGALRGISGMFRVRARAQAVPPGAQHGTFTGVLTC